MAMNNYLGGGGDLLEGQMPGVGVLSGALFNERNREHQQRFAIQNRLAQLEAEKQQQQNDDFSRAAEFRGSGYDLGADKNRYEQKYLPGEHSIRMDEQTGRLARLPYEEKLKWAKAFDSMDEYKRGEYFKDIESMQALSRGLLDEHGELDPSKIPALLRILPKDIDQTRWAGAFDESDEDANFLGTAGMDPKATASDVLVSRGTEGDTAIAPPVKVPSLRRKKAEEEIMALLRADLTGLKQRYARGTQDVTEGGLTSRNDADNATALEIARINARERANTAAKERDVMPQLARSFMAKQQAIQDYMAKKGVQQMLPQDWQALKAETGLGQITYEEQAAARQWASATAAAKAEAQATGKVGSALGTLEGLQNKPVDITVPGPIDPDFVPGRNVPGRSGQKAQPAGSPKEGEAITYKGKPAKVLKYNSDGSVTLEQDGKQVTIRPR